MKQTIKRGVMWGAFVISAGTTASAMVLGFELMFSFGYWLVYGSQALTLALAYLYLKGGNNGTKN